MKIKNTLNAGAFCSALILGAQAHAHEDLEDLSHTDDKISGWVSFDYNSHFMSSGFNVWGGDTEDIGDEFLFQPSAGINIAITDTAGVYAGIWFDINSLGGPNYPTIGGDVKEMDVWIGTYFSAGDFTFDFALQQWYYDEETEGIFDVTVSYDTLFSPYLRARTRIEIVGPTDGQQEGTMFELGGTLYEYSPDSSELVISIPVGIAANFDDYHVEGEDGYAYSFIGLSFSYPLPIAEGYGDWDIHGGLTYYHTDDDNIDNRDADGDDKNNFLTANFGIGLSF
jgi:hypothetical protein